MIFILEIDSSNMSIGDGAHILLLLLGQYEIYFTMTKFDNDYGFSLIHQEQEGGEDGVESAAQEE